jgi:hypothetical protein
MLRPRSGTGQRVVSESNVYKPNIAGAHFIDSNGNLCERMRIATGRF